LSDKKSEGTKSNLSQHGEQFQCSNDDFSEKINDNLEDISSYIKRLKGLALEMGEELDSQNELIEDIKAKTEKASMTLESQNQSIKSLI
jgi:synaptosomal-associated protein 29